jgi:phosphoribosylaminoimidazole-succinocarboxamide synthase
MTKTTGLLYEGKAKKVFLTSDPDRLVQYFKDDATAFNAQKRGSIRDKGGINNQIAEHLFRLLNSQGVSTHFISRVDERSMLVKRLKMIPIEVVVRNRVAGSLAIRLGLTEGESLSPPVYELYYKNDALGDPLINEDHVRVMKLTGQDELQIIKKHAMRINEILTPFFDQRGMILVDFKLEFGLDKGTICLGDEIGPDTCRFWDKETHESMDKDRFRRDLGMVEEAYREVFRRISQS